MRKAFLMVYSEKLGTRNEIKSCLRKIPEVITWRYDLPNSFYLISEQTPTGIAEAINRELNSRERRGRFIITEISDDKQGLLPKDTWYFIKHKRVKPKEK